jgi:hypothetical protein
VEKTYLQPVGIVPPRRIPSLRRALNDSLCSTVRAANLGTAWSSLPLHYRRLAGTILETYTNGS